MKRWSWVLGAAFALVILAAPASAQVQVDAGVVTPNVDARVTVGVPGVYVVDRYDEPAYVPYDRHWKHKRAKEWAKREREHAREYYKDMREHDREYYKDMREARREQEKDRREAEREYLKDLREAEREYEKDRREAWRDRRW